MSCSFLLFPGEESARIIGQHPSPDALSDALGGAIPAPIRVGHQHVAAWVRESAVTEGLDRNPLAGVMAQVLGAPVIPLVGPVAFTLISWRMAGPHLSGEARAFSELQWKPLLTIANDLAMAVWSFDDGFSDPALGAEWAARVRARAAAVQTVPIPDGWPYHVTNPTDCVAALMRILRLGQRFEVIPPGVDVLH